MPIHFAEHHVAGEDHHLGGRLALVGDRQPVARFVQAQAADQPPAVEMPAVGHAGVQAVAHQVVDLVDVDRPGEHAAKNRVALPSARLAGDQRRQRLRLESPIVAQHVGHFAVDDEPLRASCSWSGNLRQAQVFDRMAERPVADVVQQRRREQQLGIVRRDGGGEPLVGGQPVQVFDRRQEHAQRMLLPRVVRRRIDEAHQAQLADLRQPAKGGRVDQPPHASRQRHIDAGRNPHQPARPPRNAANLGDVVDRGHGSRADSI